MKNTVAVSIISLQHPGGLLMRFVGEVGVLPGTTIMVPGDCWCVLVAGDQATAVFDVGPHELQLKQFNRQPSGLLYTVGRDPETFSWYPKGSPYRRTMRVRVGNPLQFVFEMAVRRSTEDTEAVGDALQPHFDAMVPPGQILAQREEARRAIAESLAHVGLVLVEIEEESAVASDVPPPAPAPTPQATAPEQEEQPRTGHDLVISEVWSSSTMDLFGKGELTLRARLLGRSQADFDPAGPFTYDATLEYLSPDEWLAEKTWQQIPPEALRFQGLEDQQYYRLYLVAEERDRSSVDPLGTLEWELGQLGPGELEIGPTQGGKRGQFVKLKARFQ